MFRKSFSLVIVPLLAALSLIVGACSGGGSDGGSTTAPPPAPATGSVTITGAVSGTVIKVLNAMTDQVIVPSFDTATLNQPPPFPFSIANVPTGLPLRIFFVTGGAVYPLYFGATNVFTFTSGDTVNLGQVDTANGKATPDSVPTNMMPGLVNTNIPQTVVPPTASISVTSPSNGVSVQGPDVAITFALQNFTIGNQNQAHLHVYLDGDQTPYEFLNGLPSGQVLHNGNPATNAQWVTGTEIRFLGLSANATHTVQFKLSTASHAEYVNPEASKSVQFTVNPPPPAPPTINVTSPADNQSLIFGPVTVEFNVTNFTIQGQGQPQLHFYLDGNTNNIYQFLNDPPNTNRVLLNGNPVANVVWVTTSSFKFTSLTAGQHSLRLVLANGDAANTELPQATDILPFTVEPAPGSTPTLTINSPPEGAILPVGPVLVTFDILNSPVPLSAAQPRMHFYVDNDPVVYKFYAGPGISEEGSLSGVRYQGVHTHFVHWKSASSIEINGLSSTTHQVRFVLTDANDGELVNPEAMKTLTFSVSVPPSGDLLLQPVITGLDFPVGLALAPDGRVFFNERLTGAIRIIDPQWHLVNTPFCQLQVEPTGERGLLGLVLDPDFATNHFVYVYYSELNADRNRVVRFTEANGLCTQQTTILNTLPQGTVHNGGIIQFGPDRKLYVVIGDNFNMANSQDLTSLAGKILRLNPDGTPPNDNPFFSNANANAKLVYARGIRNSYGFTFHGHTGHLWEAENGPDVDDEINHIIAGGNYGWPTVTGIAGNQNFLDPILAYTPTIAPTGIISIPETSTVYPMAYQNNLLFVDYNGGKIRRVILSGADLTLLGTESIAYNGGQGGLLSLMLGADGFVYVSSTGGGIFKVVPQ